MRNGHDSILLLLLLLLILATPLAAQSEAFDQLKAELRETAKFTEEDFEALEDGELVIKKLPAKDRREVAVCGVIKLYATQGAARVAFSRSLRNQTRNSAKKHGRFSNPPKSSDLGKNPFDEDDLIDLKACRVGSCKWNLPAAMIERIGNEVDWNEPSAGQKAAGILSGFLTGYVRDYLQTGDEALIEYNDKRNPLNLKREFGSMTEELFWLESQAPDFLKFIRSYPEVKLDGIEETVTWSEVKIALKPVFMINHNVNYPVNREDGGSRFVAFSKQIYSNHYFDSSLTQTIMISVTNEDEPENTYVMFVNRSRAGALGGRLGRFARGLVQNQARGKLEELLTDTRRYSATVMANLEGSENPEDDDGWTTRFFSDPTLIWTVVLLPVLGLVMWLVVRAVRRRGIY